MVGFIINNWVFAVFGVILAGLYGYGLWKSDKERFDYGERDMGRHKRL